MQSIKEHATLIFKNREFESTKSQSYVKLKKYFSIETDICCWYSRNYHLLSQTVGRYRTKVPKIEATRLGLLRTSKISTIDPIVAELCPFEKRSIFL